MRSTRTLGTVFSIVATVVSTGVALAQAPSPPGGAVTPVTPPAGATGEGFGGAGAVFLALLGLLIIVGAGVKLYDLRRKREADAVHLQAQVSDALLREPTLIGLAITPTAHIPTWSGSPAVIQVTGQVPTPDMKDAALRIVETEARRLRDDFRIDDQIAIVRTMEQRRSA
jgi:hypothetical protein